jgi:[glutamine synthetase] adenylyltransferase / [glutamine synthetase]-adenylyl-L-tyrosine phosphorylase
LGTEQVTTIALGKFGGREISYGADLDVLFVGDDIRAAQKIMIAMAQQTAEGNIWALDARLRPEGEKGPLVCSIETYQSYYAGRAQPWELQALSRARGISGPLQREFMQTAKNAWRRVGQDSNLCSIIDGMLERIRRERGSGSDFLDLKTGRGGIIEAEFLVQALQMRGNVWEQNLDRAIDRLCQHGTMTDSEATKLKNAYALLRRCELVLRRYDNRSVSTLPSDPDEQRKFAVRLGYHELEAFSRDYVNSRDTIRTLYERHVPNKSSLATFP